MDNGVQDNMDIKGLRRAHAKAFGDFLLGKNGNPLIKTEKVGPFVLKREGSGKIVLEFKDVTIARGDVDEKTKKPHVELSPLTPTKALPYIEKIFAQLYTRWSKTAEKVLARDDVKFLNDMLDPPKNGASEIELSTIMMADVEIMSLKDVVKNVSPEGVVLTKFRMSKDDIEVVYSYTDQEKNIRAPIFRLTSSKKGVTKIFSGDGVSPAPVGYFMNLLEKAREYNVKVCGPAIIKKAIAGLTEDSSDKKVTMAIMRHIDTEEKTPVVSIDSLQVAVVPKVKSACVYINKVLIARINPGEPEENWIRPGFGWSNRADLANRAVVHAGRIMLENGYLKPGVDKEWEEDLDKAIEEELDDSDFSLE